MKISRSLNIEFFILILIVASAMVYSHGSGLDMTLASYFFNPTDQWIFRDSFILEKIFHKGGVILSTALLIGLLCRWIYLIKYHDDKKQRDYVGFVFLSSIFIIITVFFLKRWSTLPCPWNSVVFGGSVNPPSLWQAFASELPKQKCFPAGHSSGGLCFISMYFGHTAIYGKRNFKTLIPGLLIGLIFGITQQMRGAHYLSHDLTTVLITITLSWITSLFYTDYNRNHEK